LDRFNIPYLTAREVSVNITFNQYSVPTCLPQAGGTVNEVIKELLLLTFQLLMKKAG